MIIKNVFKCTENGDEYDYWLGKCVNKLPDKDITVTRLEYHQPMGEGDAHYVDVTFSDGEMRRIFRPDVIDFV